MELSRVDRVLHTIDPAKLSATGLTVTGVTVALLPVRSAPTSGTVWVALTSYVAPTTAKIRLAGPDADSTAALVVTADCDLWALVTDGTQTEAVKIERINLEGSSGTVTPLPSTYVTSVNGKSGVATLTFSDVGADAAGAATAAQTAAQTFATNAIATQATADRAAYGRPVRTDSVAFMGDSITGLNGTGDSVATFHNYADNYSHFLTTLLKGQVRFAGVYSTSGQTMAQIRDVVMPRLFAMPQAQWPGTVVVLGGTNDVGSSVPVATTIGALNDIFTALNAHGMRMVCATIPPRGDTANQLVGPLNQAIQKFARDNGLHCLPFHAALVAATGGYVSGYAIGDNIHPSRLGMMAMAQAAITAGIGNAFPTRIAPTVKSTADTTDLLGGYGLFLNDANSDGLADGWGTGGTLAYTPSLVTPAGGDNLAGKWQRLVVASGGSNNRYVQYVGSVTNSSGTDLLELNMRIRISGATAGLTTSNTASVTLSPRGQTTSDQTLWASSVDITDGVITLQQRCYTGTNAFAVTINPAIPSTGSLTIDVGEVTVRNLTALGQA